MKDILHLFVILATVAFPFVAMVFLWKRMKLVRNQTYIKSKKAAPQPAWQEEIQSADGISLGRSHNPNESLIAMGSKAEQARWPIDN